MYYLQFFQLQQYTCRQCEYYLPNVALESAVMVSELMKKLKFIDSAVSIVIGLSLTVNGF